jgi:hypothetical protein
VTIQQTAIDAAIERVKPTISADMPDELRAYVLQVAEVAGRAASDVTLVAAFAIPLTVWHATAACGDDENERMTEDLGIYSTEAEAQAVAAHYPRTGGVEKVVVDEVPDWVAVPPQ